MAEREQIAENGNAGTLNIDERDLLSLLRGFFGFACTSTALLLLFFSPPLFTRTLGDGLIPAIVILAAFVVLFLVLFRAGTAFFATRRASLLVCVVALLGTCVFPLVLLHETMWVAALPFIAAGIVSMLYSWCTCLCRYSRSILALLVPTGLSLALGAACVISFYATADYVIVAVACILMLLAWVCALFERSRGKIQLLLVSAKESKERAISVRMDRWITSTIGLDFGFAIGLVHCLYGLEGFGDTVRSGTEANPFLLIFAVSALLAGLLLPALCIKFEYLAEERLKVYLSFTTALGVLPLCFLPVAWQTACLILLLITSFVQLIFSVNASIEFIQFEELSPAWYMAETAFNAGGITVGIFLAWIGTTHTLSSPVFLACCILIVLFNISSQPFINKTFYPTIEQIQTIRSVEGGESCAVAATSLTQTPYAEGQPCPVLPDTAGEVRSGAWRAKVNYVAHMYGLSPRQGEILGFLAKGRDAKFIEDYFCISHSTAKTHIYNIYCKLDIHSRQELLDIVEGVPVPRGDDKERVPATRTSL